MLEWNAWWGPLGPLPSGWVRLVDNDDYLWRPYYTDVTTSTEKYYWTRPWSSVMASSPGESWNPKEYAKYVMRSFADDAVFGAVKEEPEGTFTPLVAGKNRVPLLKRHFLMDIVDCARRRTLKTPFKPAGRVGVQEWGDID
jgi:hypothetical protein